jgi:hypothetical protein
VGGQRHALAALPRWRRRGIHCVRGWASVWAGLENFASTRFRTADRPARSWSRDKTKYMVTRKQIKCLQGMIGKLLIMLNIWQSNYIESKLGYVFILVNLAGGSKFWLMDKFTSWTKHKSWAIQASWCYGKQRALPFDSSSKCERIILRSTVSTRLAWDPVRQNAHPWKLRFPPYKIISVLIIRSALL